MPVNVEGLNEKRAVFSAREAQNIPVEAGSPAITKRAERIAQNISGLRNPQTRGASEDRLKGILEGNWNNIGYEVKSIENLRRCASDNPQAFGLVMNEGQINAARELYLDFADGLALETIWRIAKDPALRVAIRRDDVEKVKSLLGSRVLIGGETIVMGSAITSDEVLGVLGKAEGLLKIRGRKEVLLGRVTEELLTMHNRISDALKDVKPDVIDPRRRNLKEIEMVLSYLNAEIEAEEGRSVVGQHGGGETSAVVDALKEMGRSESTYDTFVNAEFQQQPIQLQVDTFPPSWFKHVPDRYRDKPEDWQQLIRARINLSNAAYTKQEVAALDGEKAKNNNWLKLSERELKLMYEEPGVRLAMETIVGDLFQRSNETAGYFWSVRTGEISPKLRGWDFETYQDVFDGFQRYQKLMAASIAKVIPTIAPGMILGKSEAEAQEIMALQGRAAVGMAWNFLYTSNVMESADTERDILPSGSKVYGEQIRAMMHPLAKALKKFGIRTVGPGETEANTRAIGTEEGWGEAVGGWIADLVSFNETEFRKKLSRKELKPFPERIGASLLELIDIKTKQGSAMSIAQALMEKREITFKSVDSSLFGSYGDSWDTFWKFYLYCGGKAMIDMKKGIDDWGGDLADLLAKLRKIEQPTYGDWGGDVGVATKKMKVFSQLDDANTFRWLLCNSFGLYRSTRTMLRIPDGLNYEAVVDRILAYPRLVMVGSKRSAIKELVHGRWIDGVARAQIKFEDAYRQSQTPPTV